MKISTDKNIRLDLKNLITTRLLIQANSGGGKSWLLRKILEESHGKVQQIIIDLEGEFSTLREKYDYLICGKEGDIPINLKIAQLLPKRLLELNVSTIIDVSELKKHERILFVKRFLDGLIDAPKKLWHPCIVVIDEAHQFCPQASKSESASSVIDLMTRGRKRGFCGILATQRISKLHKDACAEANNRLIGRTGLDIDRKRASEELGFTSKEDERSLRFLDPGEFYAFGSSISKEIIKIKVGDVKTSHPEPGNVLLKVAPVPENIKKILKDVVDLSQEADEELKTTQDFQKKIIELKRELSRKPQGQIDEKVLERAKRETEVFLKRQYENIIKGLENDVQKMRQFILSFVEKSKMFSLANIKEQKREVVQQKQIIPVAKPRVVAPIFSDNGGDEYNLNLCERKLYSLLCQYPERSFTKQQIGVFTGYSHRSGSFSNSASHLKQMGLIEGNGNDLRVKEVLQELIQDFDFSKEAIITKLGKCEKQIYYVLLENPYQEYSKEELASETPEQYSANSGSFSNAIGRLNTMGIVERNNGMIKLNPAILEI